MVQGVAIVGGEIVDVDPSTGEEIGRVRVSTREEVDAVCAAAEAAQPAWHALGLGERVELLRLAVRALEGSGTASLARLVTREMGKVISEAEEEVRGACDKEQFLSLVHAANAPVTHGACTVVREPHGVVAVCAPWNYPVDEILLLLLPALAAGNAVVVKPSEVAPMCGARVVEAVRSALPARHAAVVGLLQGDGEVGAMLVEHAAVSMVAMTGSSAVGSKIVAAAAAGLKRVMLELGGKDPMVVFGDADLDAAAKDAVAYSLANAGQVCCAVERVYVDEAVAPAFEAKVVEEARAWVCGPGLDGGSSVGPLVSSLQREHVHSHVRAAVEAGGRCVLGGEMPTARGGYFYPPTVLADVPHECRTTREETFGPVVALSAFDGTEEAAVRLANATSYGLAASVYSGDVERATRVAARIRAGQVGINSQYDKADPRCPWVGHKMSGFGHHSGDDGWRQFSLPKSLINVPPNSTLAPAASADAAVASAPGRAQRLLDAVTVVSLGGALLLLAVAGRALKPALS